MTIAIVYTVFANTDEATRIGRALIEERLAACINILGPCTSIYRWEGKIEQATEVPAVLKTTIETADALIERLVELHSYEVPAVAAWPVERTPAAYRKWVETSVKG